MFQEVYNDSAFIGNVQEFENDVYLGIDIMADNQSDCTELLKRKLPNVLNSVLKPITCIGIENISDFIIEVDIALFGKLNHLSSVSLQNVKLITSGDKIGANYVKFGFEYADNISEQDTCITLDSFEALEHTPIMLELSGDISFVDQEVTKLLQGKKLIMNHLLNSRLPIIPDSVNYLVIGLPYLLKDKVVELKSGPYTIGQTCDVATYREISQIANRSRQKSARK